MLSTDSNSRDQQGMKRVLAWWDLAGIGIGCMVGVGIFVLPGIEAAQHAGPAISLSFLLAAVVVSLTALAYAELATMMPLSGGAYSYCHMTFGVFPGWLMGWSLMLEYLVATSMVAVGWSAYLVHLLSGFGLALPPALTSPAVGAGSGFANLPAVLIVSATLLVVMIGVQESARLALALVLLKICAVLVFLGDSAPHINPANWSPFMPFGFSGVLTATSIVFIAFGGFDAISTAAEEAKNPQKDLPIGLLVSLGVVALAYMSVAAVMTGVVPFHELDVADPMTVVLTAAKHPWVSRLVSVAALIGMSSVLLAMLVAQPRIMFAMARDGLLPAGLAKIQPRSGIPLYATLISATIVMVMAALLPIQIIAELCSMGFLLASVVVCLAVLILRKRNPELQRPFRMPWAGVLAPFGVGCNLLLIVMLPFATQLRFGLWLILGIIIYLFMKQRSKGDTNEPA
jgi:basic amino acid/polyamine antiporter, APA family